MVEATGMSWHKTNRGVSLFIAIYVVLYLFVVYLSKLLHDRPAIARFLPEAGMVILVGMLAGVIFTLIAGGDHVAGDVAEFVLGFDSSVFFIVLLPPVIFNSGYHLHRELFLRYFNPICLFAFGGTMISTAVVAGLLYLISTALPNFSPTISELLAFGALISATDPVSTLAVFSAKKVDPQLFYLLSGESLLNDAVGLVLFGAFAHLIEVEKNGAMNLGNEILQVFLDVAVNFFGSLLMGGFLGLLLAFTLKQIDLRETPILELSVYVMTMYAPFVLAEICHFSGIVTVLFAAMAARRYAEPNLSTFASATSDTIFRLVAHVTETLIFLELGLSVPSLLSHHENINFIFILFAFLVCLISRAVNIYPLAFLYNTSQRYCCRKNEDNKTGFLNQPSLDNETGGNPCELQKIAVSVVDDRIIPIRTVHFLFFSGLRGAVSYGLAKMFPEVSENRATFEVATILIVLVTTFVFGGATDVALQKLQISVGVDEKSYMKSIHKTAPAVSPGRKLWLRFERSKLYPVVLRDYNKQETICEGKDQVVADVIGQQKKESIDEFVYYEPQEVTVEDHEKLTMCLPQNPGRRWSIYDYGK